MKYIITLLMMVEMATAEGFTLFEKSTGILQERYTVSVILNDVGEMNTHTNWTFRKLQPKETIVLGKTILGSQVLKNVDWIQYDLARYDSASDNPQTTNDLTGVVRQYVYESQTAKTNGKKQYENGYFLLVKSVLTLANDPRKDVTPIPKLSFDELDGILDVLYETPSTEKKANKLALKLLSVNSALIRYDINWWDSATFHSDI